jgi:A/G-specific adenine glycosylase
MGILTLQQNQIIQFQNEIFSWWEHNRRDFPWRNTKNPYHILVSEFMLQQTQVSRVVKKYEEFINTFPTMDKLINSETRTLLAVWLGLGYNRRAIWLKQTVSEIVKRRGFPNDPAELIKFKGIGKYSSNSIAIFAFNLDYVAVDVNIKRVLLHYEFITTQTSEKDIYRIAKELLPKGQSRDWHNALMDFGAINLKHIKFSTKKYQPYKGSIREIRGDIIKILTRNGPIPHEKLVEHYYHRDIDKIIKELIKDRLIKKRFNELFI